MAKFIKFALPLMIFVALLALLLHALQKNDDKELSSTLINQPAPAFELPQLNVQQANLGQNIHSSTLNGSPWLLHVFASWCISCVQEHTVIMQMANLHNINIIGYNYKDRVEDASNWLKRFGNPYKLIVSDFKGHTAIDYGVTGTPETFIIDKSGIIRHKIVGPIETADVKNIILPMLAQLQNETNK